MARISSLPQATELMINYLLWIPTKQVWPYLEVCQLTWLNYKVQLRVVGYVEKSIWEQMEVALIISRMVINSPPKG